MSLSSSSTIAKLAFVQLDANATELVGSSQFTGYDAMIDGLAPQSSRSFLRIGELAPDLSKPLRPQLPKHSSRSSLSPRILSIKRRKASLI